MINKNLLACLTISIIILFTFYNLPNTFFQQDEWHSFGYIISRGLRGYLMVGYTLPLSVFISRPIAKVFTTLCFYLFNLNYFYYGLISILLHCLNSGLVYFLAKRLTKDTPFAFLTILFFTFNSISSQAIIWFSALNSAAISFTFILLTLISFSYFIENKKGSYFYFSLITFIFAVLAKESSLFLIVLFPLFSFIFKSKQRALTAENLSFLGVGVFYFVLRFLESIVSCQPQWGGAVNQGNGILKLLLRLIFYPLEGLSQLFIPASWIYAWAGKLILLFHPWLWKSALFGSAKETIFSEFVSLAASFFLLIIFLLLGWHLRKGKKRKERTLWFSLAFLVTSFFPYIFLPKSTAFLESRHYYPAVLGGALLFGLLLSEGLLILLHKRNLSFFTATLILVALFLFGHIRDIQREIKLQLEIGTVRRMILEKIRQRKPKLDQKTIFYINGNTPYVLPEVKIPFQQGFGWTLLVWYFKTGTVEPQFFTDESLWGILHQGYKEYGERGFGYFRDYDKLIEAVEKYHLQRENIYAFFYDAKKKQLLDITREIRQRLKENL